MRFHVSKCMWPFLKNALNFSRIKNYSITDASNAAARAAESAAVAAQLCVTKAEGNKLPIQKK